MNDPAQRPGAACGGLDGRAAARIAALDWNTRSVWGKGASVVAGGGIP